MNREYKALIVQQLAHDVWSVDFGNRRPFVLVAWVGGKLRSIRRDYTRAVRLMALDAVKIFMASMKPNPLSKGR